MGNEKAIIKKVDSVGRISIPAKIFDELNIKEEAPIILHVDNNKISMKKDYNFCVFCGNPEIVVHETDIPICSECRDKKENILNIVDKRYEKQLLKKGKRLVIPFKIRHHLGIESGDLLKISVKDDSLEIEKIENEK